MSHSRGNGTPRSDASTRTRSCRSAAPSTAQNRTTASPFQAETPTSPRNVPASPRTRTAVSSSAGTTSTVAIAMPPRRPRAARACPRSRHRAAMASAWTSAPFRRTRQRSSKRPSPTVSPIPERPNTSASASSSRASSARSISIERSSRARSNRMVSCGSQASTPPAPTASFTSMVASGSRVR